MEKSKTIRINQGDLAVACLNTIRKLTGVGTGEDIGRITSFGIAFESVLRGELFQEEKEVAKDDVSVQE